MTDREEQCTSVETGRRQYLGRRRDSGYEAVRNILAPSQGASVIDIEGIRSAEATGRYLIQKAG